MANKTRVRITSTGPIDATYVSCRATLTDTQIAHLVKSGFSIEPLRNGVHMQSELHLMDEIKAIAGVQGAYTDRRANDR